MRHRPWAIRATLVLSAIGILLFASALWTGRGAKVFSWPIRPLSGFTITRDFRVSSKGNYTIEARCSRSIPFDQMKGLLQAGNLVEIKVTADGTAVALHYLPQPRFQAGVDSSAEWGNLNFAQDSIGQDIAYFSADPKKRYTITCTVVRTVDELNETNPTLLVWMNPLEANGGLLRTALLMLAAAASGILAVVFAIIYFFWRKHPSVVQRPA
jgi:hypothetical protein